ncbi:MAG: hypothetical protein Q7S21_04160 [archaeon]|nr:hypothetical protein [archaeon]
MEKFKPIEIKGRRVRRKLSDHYVTVIEPFKTISLEEGLRRMAKLTAKYSKR